LPAVSFVNLASISPVRPVLAARYATTKNLPLSLARLVAVCANTVSVPFVTITMSADVRLVFFPAMTLFNVVVDFFLTGERLTYTLAIWIQADSKKWFSAVGVVY